jgi:hypothetical protein
VNDFSDPKRAKLQRFNELLKQVKELEPGDHDGLEAIIKVAVDARLGDTHVESLISAAKKYAPIKIARGFVAKAQADLKKRDADQPDAREERERRAEAVAEAARREKEAEIARLFASCRDIAESPTLLADMESVVHRLGVIGEGASIRGAYLAETSRLLRYAAISYLRRGAASAGKNHPLLKILSLFTQDEDYIRITTASAMALIYSGDDQNAIKHKIIVIGEAAAIAARSNGDESPVTIMVRQLISENQINHLVTLRQNDGSFRTKDVRRDGPVSVWMTSARNNVEDELLTRLQTSDADESNEQTRRVIRAGWEGRRSNVSPVEIEKWAAFQRWLRTTAPPGGYEVEIPFAKAIGDAHDDMHCPHAVAPAARRSGVSPGDRSQRCSVQGAARD